MRFFDSLSAVPAGFGPSAVTIGKFDGVHAGHRAVLAELRATAAERDLVATVITFDRNPLQLLDPARCPEALVSNAKKVELLEATGVDAALMLAFDQAFSEQPPEEFVRSVLVTALSARVVFVGEDFRFGARGSGTVAMLDALGAEYGFEVRHIQEVLADAGAETTSGANARRASSTWI